MATMPDVTGWDPRDPKFRADPYPWYRVLREQEPVFRHPDVGYVISRAADVEALLRDARFSVSTPSPWRELLAEQAAPALRNLGESTLLFIDPPAHTRVRGLVAKAFSPRRIALLRPHIEQTIDRLLDEVASRLEFDVLVEIAEPLPILAITHLLGVPDADWTELHRWTTVITAFNELPVDFGALPGANVAAAEFSAYCDDLVTERRAAPGDDFVSALLAAEDDGQRLDHGEVIGMIILLLMAGHDTTKSLISSGIRELLRHPDQAAILREDTDVVAPGIEELLRYESPLHVASGVADGRASRSCCTA